MLTRSKRTVPILIYIIILFLASCKEDTITPIGYGTINGLIADAETNVPISGAAISTSPPTTAILSDANGLFRIENVAAGSYTIGVQKSGYGKAAINIAVAEDKTTNASVLLQKNGGSNVPPASPTNPSPANQGVNQPVSVRLSWSATGVGSADSLRFDVFLYESSQPAPKQVANDVRDTSLVIDSLKYGTTYFWQVVVKDTANLTSNSALWSFSTRSLPDNRVVFASLRDGNYEVYSADSLGGNIVQLTHGSSRTWWPRLSPRKDRIVYSSDELVQSHIYAINRDGSGRSRLTTISVSGYNNYGTGFCYSPDGGLLVYAHNDKLYRIDASNYSLIQIATAPANRHFRECDWTSVGNKIVVLTIGQNSYDSEIYVMNADGSNMTLVVDNLPGTIESPTFSVDGNRIMFTRDVSGYESVDGRQLDAHVYILRLDHTDSIDVSTSKQNGTNDLAPRFSPDGSRIIFANTLNDNSAVKDIWIMNSDGTNRHKIIDNGEMPDWK